MRAPHASSSDNGTLSGWIAAFRPCRRSACCPRDSRRLRSQLSVDCLHATISHAESEFFARVGIRIAPPENRRAPGHAAKSARRISSLGGTEMQDKPFSRLFVAALGLCFLAMFCLAQEPRQEQVSSDLVPAENFGKTIPLWSYKVISSRGLPGNGWRTRCSAA